MNFDDSQNAIKIVTRIPMYSVRSEVWASLHGTSIIFCVEYTDCSVSVFCATSGPQKNKCTAHSAADWSVFVCLCASWSVHTCVKQKVAVKCNTPHKISWKVQIIQNGMCSECVTGQGSGRAFQKYWPTITCWTWESGVRSKASTAGYVYCVLRTDTQFLHTYAFAEYPRGVSFAHKYISTLYN